MKQIDIEEYIKEMITVYTKPGCPQCDKTFLWLDTKGIKYKKVDILKEPTYRDLIIGWGFSSLPVVDAGNGNVWGGHKLEKLEELIKQ